MGTQFMSIRAYLGVHLSLMCVIGGQIISYLYKREFVILRCHYQRFACSLKSELAVLKIKYI